MLVIAFILAWFGLCLGSFVNALVWRIHKHKNFVHERSQCPRCGHQLAAADLVPVVSWLALRGRCRYCGKPISRQYPAVELAMGLVFALSYIFWPEPLHGGQYVLLVTWLLCCVGLMALLVYDLKWMILPSSIIYTTAAAAAAGRLIYIVGYQNDKPRAIGLWVLSLGVAAGIFWVLYQINERYIGGGDIRLGLVTGTLLASPLKSFLMIFLASVLGTIFMLPALAAGRSRMSTKLPYGPFLIIATAIVLFAGQGIIDWYGRLSP